MNSDSDEDVRVFPRCCYLLECSLVRGCYPSSTPLALNVCDYIDCCLSAIGINDGETRRIAFARDFIAITITAIKADGLASVV